MKEAIILIFMILTTVAIATDYYVDASGGDDSNDGLSDATAWRTISKVNSFSFQEGDDVYFKCSERWDNADTLHMDWNGTSDDWAIIGSYYMDNGSATHGSNGSHPIFDGGYTNPANKWLGLISLNNREYVRLENMKVVDSKGEGIEAHWASNFEIINCIVNTSYMSGITVHTTNENGGTGLIEGCDISGFGKGWHEGNESDWPSGISGYSSPYMTYRKNNIHEGWGEGLIVGTIAENGLVSHDCVLEKNILYDCRSLGIMAHNVHDTIVRYNFIFDTPNTFNRYWYDGIGWGGDGIFIGDEPQWDHGPENGYALVYGNVIYRGNSGIKIAFQTDAVDDHHSVMTDTLVANNILVNNWDNFKDYTWTSDNGSVINNIIYDTGPDYGPLIGGDMVTTNGVVYDYNLWGSEPPEYVKGTNDPPYSDPGFVGSDFDSQGTSLDVDLFDLLENSSAIDAGMDLSQLFSEVMELADSRFQGQVNLTFNDQDSHGSGWEIGADIHDSDAQCTDGENRSCDTGRQGICSAGTEYCVNSYWNDTCIQDQQAQPEVCDNSLDDDCDGLADCEDDDCNATGACAINLCQGIQALYHMEGDSQDSSGNGNHGSVSGAALADGRYGQGFYFDQNSHITINASSSINIIGNITVSVWVRPDTSLGIHHILAKAYHGTNPRNNPYVLYTADDSYRFGIRNDAGGHAYAEAASSVQQGTWQHVVGVYDGTNLSIYVDNLKAGSLQVTKGSEIDNNPLYIGTDDSEGDGILAYSWNGSIDEVAVWDRAFDTREVNELNQQELCCHPADTDRDGTISKSEIRVYVQQWMSGSASMGSMMTALESWKSSH